MLNLAVGTGGFERSQRRLPLRYGLRGECARCISPWGAQAVISFQSVQAHRNYRRTASKDRGELTLILVAPFTDFSKFCVIVHDQLVRAREKRSWQKESKKRRTLRYPQTDLCRRLPFRLANWRLRWRLQQRPSWWLTGPCQQRDGSLASARWCSNGDQGQSINFRKCDRPTVCRDSWREGSKRRQG